MFYCVVLCRVVSCCVVLCCVMLFSVMLRACVCMYIYVYIPGVLYSKYAYSIVGYSIV